MYLLRRSAVGAGRAAVNATAPVQYGDTTIVRRVDQRKGQLLGWCIVARCGIRRN